MASAINNGTIQRATQRIRRASGASLRMPFTYPNGLASSSIRWCASRPRPLRDSAPRHQVLLRTSPIFLIGAGSLRVGAGSRVGVSRSRQRRPVGRRYLKLAQGYTAAHPDGIVGYTAHQLRHVCASLLIASGASDVQVAHQMGHAKIETTKPCV
jgi:integrase